MATIEEALSTQELIDYMKTPPKTDMLLETLFPSRKSESLDVKMIRGANNLPVSATVHAFDSETEIDSREGAKFDIAEKVLIKRKRSLNEKELIILTQPRNSIEETQIINKIFNDVDVLYKSVLTRVEAFRGEALSTGKLVINENNYKTTIDYAVPSGHKATYTWGSGTPDILGNLYDACDTVLNDSGFSVTRALTSKKVINKMLKDASVRKAIYGVNSDKMLTLTDLNTFLQSEGFPQVAAYDKRYRVLGKNGKYTSCRFFPENAFVLMPDGNLGESIYGPTAEEIELRTRPGVDVSSVGNVCVVQYATEDPTRRWIKAVATALVTFPCADQVFMATIA